MHDRPLDLATVPWSRQKEAVRVFYKQMWDHANTTLIPQLFHPDFTFRGSLGPQLVSAAHEETEAKTGCTYSEGEALSSLSLCGEPKHFMSIERE
jgi:hypothetical protein